MSCWRFLIAKEKLTSNFLKWLKWEVGEHSVHLKTLNCGLGKADFLSAAGFWNPPESIVLQSSRKGVFVWSTSRQSQVLPFAQIEILRCQYVHQFEDFAARRGYKKINELYYFLLLVFSKLSVENSLSTGKSRVIFIPF